MRDEVYIVRRPSLRNMGDDGTSPQSIFLSISMLLCSPELTQFASPPKETTCITFNSQEPLPSTLFDKSFDVQVLSH